MGNTTQKSNMWEKAVHHFQSEYKATPAERSREDGKGLRQPASRTSFIPASFQPELQDSQRWDWDRDEPAAIQHRAAACEEVTWSPRVSVFQQCFLKVNM